MNNDLKAKNEDLKKNQIESDSTMKKMGHVGLRRKFTVQGTFKKEDDSVKIAELIKEKDDLQEINEKMLDLLTEKEMENEDLKKKLENYKLEVKTENEKYLEKIKNLEDKIELLESEKGGTIFDIDDVMNEYNKSKERLKNQINEYSKNEEELKAQLDAKDKTIQKLNEEIQNLEVDKLKLVNQNTKKDRLKEKEVFEIEQLKNEGDKLKREVTFLEDKLKEEKENSDKLKKSHKVDMDNMQKQIESEQNNIKTVKEEKAKEINSLKAEITKLTKDMSLNSKKAEMAEKRLDDEKQKSFMIQNKLDKKTKELQEMNEYTKKLLTNKDNLITQYEEKIEEINKDKNNLIIQNKELLENMKSNQGQNTEEKKDDIQQYIHENKLLIEEIKGLKEQLENQAQDLVELNSFEKELVRLREQNEILKKDNKSLKIQIGELKRNEGEKGLGVDSNERKRGFTLQKRTFTMRTQSCEIQNQNQLGLRKQFESLKEMKEEEKKDFEKQIEKLKMEIAELKVKNVNLQYDIDSQRVKFRNMVKNITNQCKKKGITLNINMA